MFGQQQRMTLKKAQKRKKKSAAKTDDVFRAFIKKQRAKTEKETSLRDAIAKGERQRASKWRSQARADQKEEERVRRKFEKDVKSCMRHVKSFLLKAVTRAVSQGSNEIMIAGWCNSNVPVELMKHFGPVLTSAINKVNGFKAWYNREHDHDMGDVSSITVTWKTE